MVSEQDSRSSFKFSKMSKGKYHSLPLSTSGKDPIQKWEKMKKYLKRQFLPPDYKDLVYQEYLNCKQLGNSIATYTKKFYRLQSYLDFNVLEEYSISRYKNGLCWAIRERLSSQSFYYCPRRQFQPWPNIMRTGGCSIGFQRLCIIMCTMRCA